MGRLLLEEVEKLFFSRKEPEHGCILSRRAADVNAWPVDTSGSGRYDGPVKSAEPAAGRKTRCPHCGKPATWQGNPHRPFCSLACRLIDLGVWLDERYRIPAAEFPRDPVEGAHAPPREE